MRSVFWLMVFLIPVSPAIKEILGFNATLVDVSLLLAPIVFVYFRPRLDFAGWLLFAIYFLLSTVHGLGLMAEFDLSVIAIYTQAIKVALCVMFYTSLAYAFKTDR
jgi:hypothetical protein